MFYTLSVEKILHHYLWTLLWQTQLEASPPQFFEHEVKFFVQESYGNVFHWFYWAKLHTKPFPLSSYGEVKTPTFTQIVAASPWNTHTVTTHMEHMMFIVKEASA